MTLGSACALTVLLAGTPMAFDAMARQAAPGMGGAPSASFSGGLAEMKPNSVPLSAPEPDPAALSARSTACAQKADARGLEGKTRKHFLHACKRGL
jgi:hypothetical protein